MTIRNLVHNKRTHIFSPVILTIVTILMAFDWAITFTGAIDMLMGQIFAWITLIIFITVTIAEIITLIKCRINLLATVFIIAIMTIYTLYIAFAFPDFIEGRTDILI